MVALSTMLLPPSRLASLYLRTDDETSTAVSLSSFVAVIPWPARNSLVGLEGLTEKVDTVVSPCPLTPECPCKPGNGLSPCCSRRWSPRPGRPRRPRRPPRRRR